MSGGPKQIAILVIYFRRLKQLLNAYGSVYSFIALLGAISVAVVVLIILGFV